MQAKRLLSSIFPCRIGCLVGVRVLVCCWCKKCRVVVGGQEGGEGMPVFPFGFCLRKWRCIIAL